MPSTLTLSVQLAVCWRSSTSVLFGLLCVVMLCSTLCRSSAEIYLNKWAVQIEGGPEVADAVARQNGFRNLGQIGSLEDYYLFEQRRLVKRSINPSVRHHTRLEREPRVHWLEQQTIVRRTRRDLLKARDGRYYFNDPLWSRMWYLNREMFGTGFDMNVMGAWQQGYSGQGVVVTILDDGVEHNHTDLQQNYDPDASYDINDFDHDPMPRYDSSDDNRHGTRCAGQVAAVANNRKCTVGVAYRARIGGIRMLDGDVSDSVEAQALSFNPQHIDIYSASWGPEDNGQVIEGPAKLAREAFVHGVTKGRGGRGSIYIWASGNGGSRSDSCSCDGYANSIYTLSVSSTSEHGTKPWYLEECSSTLATTYSSGENYRERKIVTTDLHNRCTDDHTGTSASAPLAAGICALALEANPELTWRDMQYIVLMTSRTEPLQDGNWVINGVGRKVSHRYGYGLMDAEAMIYLAERWTTVPPQQICATEVNRINRTIEKPGAVFEVWTDGCAGTKNEINYLEHVQVRVTLSHSRRGDLQLYLVSPNGTRSTLLPKRKDDFQAGKLDGWPFMSVFYWGEHPNGTWTLHIENGLSQLSNGLMESWQLIMYGTETEPVHVQDNPVQRTKTTPASTSSAAAASSLSPKNTSSFVDVDQDVNSNISDNDTVLNASLVDHPDVRTTQQADIVDESVVNETSTVAVVWTAAMTTTTPSSLSDPTSVLDGYDFTVDETVSVANADTPSSSVTVLSEPFQEPTLSTAVVDESVEGELGDRSSTTSAAAVVDFENETTSPFTNVYASSLFSELLPSPTLSTGSSAIDSDSTVDSPLGNSSSPVIELISGTNCSSSLLSTVECINSSSLLLNETSRNVSRDSLESDSVLTHDYTVSTVDAPPDLSETSTESVNDDDLLDANVTTDGFLDRNETVEETIECDIECSDDGCTGPFATDCFSCRHVRMQDTNRCVIDCPPLGTYHNVTSGLCELCPYQCSLCSVDSYGQNVVCDRCEAGYYRLAVSSNSTVCSGFCPLGFYADSFERSCEPCSKECAECSVLATQCLVCADEFEMIGYMCFPRCTAGQFRAEDGSCQPCEESCASCIGPSVDDCSECATGLWVEDGLCVPNCSEGHYPILINSAKFCHMCYPSCMSCFGPNKLDCFTCYHPFKIIGTTCHESCPVGFYENDEAVCYPCHDSCETCNGPSESSCLTCRPAMFFLDGQCVNFCPSGYFESTRPHALPSDVVETVTMRDFDHGYASGEAEQLDSNAINSDEIVTRVDIDTDNVVSRVVSRTVLSSSSSSTSVNVEFRYCQRCHSSCAECDGETSESCTDCRDTLYLSDGQCVQQCSAAQYADEGRCQLCDSRCETCIGPTDADCRSCPDGSYWDSNHCVFSCRNGFYADDELRSCRRCNSDCFNCTDAFSCLSCVAPRTLYGNYCVECCTSDDEMAVSSAIECCLCNPDTGLCRTPSTVPSLQTTISVLSDVTDSLSEEELTTGVSETSTPPVTLSTTTESVSRSSVSATLLILTSSSADIVNMSFLASQSLYSSSEKDNLTDTTLYTDLLTSSLSSDNSYAAVMTTIPSLHVNGSSATTSTVGSETMGVAEVTTVLPSDTAKISEASTAEAVLSVENRTAAVVDDTTNTASFGPDAEDSTDPASTVDSSFSLLATKPSPPNVFFPVVSVWLFIFIAVFIVVIVILAAVIVLLVRARSQHKLCWTKPHQCYLPVPLFYQNGANLVRVDAHTITATTTPTTATVKVTAEMAPLTSV